MTQPNSLELAKQGDPHAIASLMNRSLEPKGITAAVDRDGDRLYVLLTSEQVPHRQALTRFVETGLKNLDVPSIRFATVLGQQRSANTPAWSQEIQFYIDEASLQSAAPPAGSAPEASPPKPPASPASPPLVGEMPPDEVELTKRLSNLPESDASPLSPPPEPPNPDAMAVPPAQPRRPVPPPITPLRPAPPPGVADDAIASAPKPPDDEPVADTYASLDDLFQPEAPPHQEPLEEAPRYRDPLVPTPEEHRQNGGISHGTAADPVSRNGADSGAQTPPTFQPIQNADMPPLPTLDARSIQPPPDHPDDSMEWSEIDAHNDDEPTSVPPPVPVAAPDPVAHRTSPLFVLVLLAIAGWAFGLIGYALWLNIFTPQPQPAPPPPAPASSLPPSPAAPANAPTVMANPLQEASERAERAEAITNSAQSADDWQLAVSQWQQAIAVLVALPADHPDYNQSQQRLPVYRQNLASTQQRLATLPTPGGEVAPLSTVTIANGLTCPTVEATFESQPVELSNVQFTETAASAEAAAIVGCISNHTNQAIGSAAISYQATSPQTPEEAQSGVGNLAFSDLNPQQTVPFESTLALDTGATGITIQSLSYTPVGATQAQQIQAAVVLTR